MSNEDRLVMYKNVTCVHCGVKGEPNGRIYMPPNGVPYFVLTKCHDYRFPHPKLDNPEMEAMWKKYHNESALKELTDGTFIRRLEKNEVTFAEKEIVGFLCSGMVPATNGTLPKSFKLAGASYSVKKGKSDVRTSFPSTCTKPKCSGRGMLTMNPEKNSAYLCLTSLHTHGLPGPFEALPATFDPGSADGVGVPSADAAASGGTAAGDSGGPSGGYQSVQQRGAAFREDQGEGEPPRGGKFKPQTSPRSRLAPRSRASKRRGARKRSRQQEDQSTRDTSDDENLPPPQNKQPSSKCKPQDELMRSKARPRPTQEALGETERAAGRQASRAGKDWSKPRLQKRAPTMDEEPRQMHEPEDDDLWTAMWAKGIKDAQSRVEVPGSDSPLSELEAELASLRVEKKKKKKLQNPEDGVTYEDGGGECEKPGAENNEDYYHKQRPPTKRFKPRKDPEEDTLADLGPLAGPSSSGVGRQNANKTSQRKAGDQASGNGDGGPPSKLDSLEDWEEQDGGSNSVLPQGSLVQLGKKTLLLCKGRYYKVTDLPRQGMSNNNLPKSIQLVEDRIADTLFAYLPGWGMVMLEDDLRIYSMTELGGVIYELQGDRLVRQDFN